ncbi:MAG: Hsp20/alpha crystallin family protein [Nitrospirae bacterium]|nr:Hsp20/alpha crystallin family protein [Nitrospirota bacterium]
MGGRYWDDMDEFMSLHERFNKLFYETRNDNTVAYTWTPPFDIYETESEFLVKGEVPGVKQNDVSIQVEDKVLTIKGERLPKKDADREYYHCMERNFGKFMRSFSLPESVNLDDVHAELSDGILVVSIPKAPPKKITVKYGEDL